MPLQFQQLFNMRFLTRIILLLPILFTVVCTSVFDTLPLNLSNYYPDAFKDISDFFPKLLHLIHWDIDNQTAANNLKNVNRNNLIQHVLSLFWPVGTLTMTKFGRDCKVTKVHVKVGDAVELGRSLVSFDKGTDANAPVSGLVYSVFAHIGMDTSKTEGKVLIWSIRKVGPNVHFAGIEKWKDDAMKRLVRCKYLESGQELWQRNYHVPHISLETATQLYPVIILASRLDVPIVPSKTSFSEQIDFAVDIKTKFFFPDSTVWKVHPFGQHEKGVELVILQVHVEIGTIVHEKSLVMSLSNNFTVLSGVAGVVSGINQREGSLINSKSCLLKIIELDKDAPESHEFARILLNHVLRDTKKYNQPQGQGNLNILGKSVLPEFQVSEVSTLDDATSLYLQTISQIRPSLLKCSSCLESLKVQIRRDIINSTKIFDELTFFLLASTFPTAQLLQFSMPMNIGSPSKFETIVEAGNQIQKGSPLFKYSQTTVTSPVEGMTLTSFVRQECKPGETVLSILTHDDKNFSDIDFTGRKSLIMSLIGGKIPKYADDSHVDILELLSLWAHQLSRLSSIVEMQREFVDRLQLVVMSFSNPIDVFISPFSVFSANLKIGESALLNHEGWTQGIIPPFDGIYICSSKNSMLVFRCVDNIKYPSLNNQKHESSSKMN